MPNEHPTYFQLIKQLPPAECSHMERVAEYAKVTAIEMNFKEKEAFIFFEACRVHDIGKVQIPRYLLNKEGKLSSEEFDILKTHPLIGAMILQNIQNEYEWAPLAFKVALTHHEKYDGTGYPFGLCGNQIPLEGQICAVADVYDALCSKRPYKDPWTHEQAINYIIDQKGRHFSPIVVDHFLYAFDNTLIGREVTHGTG